jgi:NAD(P)-dependent dehydrogenase (short-subunit alcohol dehydrogenase family)
MSSGTPNKVALVTGTSSGIGLSAAVLLAQSGFTVVATMRNLAKSAPLEARAQAAKVALDVQALDVQDGASVQRCVDYVLRTYGRLDVLVNNAGAGLLGSLEQTSFEAMQQTMDINFYGVWRTTQAVLPAMRAAQSGRIISVSSIGGLIGQPFNDAYCAAKFAVEGCMESLAPVAKRLGIHVSLIEPGPVNTEFVATVVKGIQPGDPSVSEAYRPLLEAYTRGSQQVFASLGQTPDEVAAVILDAATAETPHLRYTTSATIQGLAARKYVDTSGDSVVVLSGARLP